ncbi:MAG: ribosomal protein S18-alanine N-acetyltransferase [Oscillospiraceae bacterium]|nr:ribosomal protein S18-alanine N-acetyltransferase [Oscillospiraceae bacterium]
MALVIRKADLSCLDAVEKIEELCFSLPWTREQLGTAMVDERQIFLVAEDVGEILGYVSMMFVLDEAYIGNVAVAPEHRRRGVASALLESLLQRVKAMGLAFVTLEVRATNMPAIALYEQFGFSVVGRRKNYYSAPTEDALIMTRVWK